MMTSVKWFDREVERQPWRALLVVAVCLAMVGLIVVMGVAVVVCTPLHPLFRMADRNGFWRVDNDALRFNATLESFRRREGRSS